MLKVVFFGTPDFAVASLDILYKNNIDIKAVVTAPDKPSGRGMQAQMSDVKKYALTHNIPLLQPQKLKDNVFISQLKNIEADIFIVVAFRMLPEIIWNMPPMGTINVHGSLLPKYRGAAPIHWAIIHGEKETGVTTFKLKHEIDTGNILLQKKIVINEDDNLGTMYDKMKYLGAEVLLETLQGMANHTIIEKAQILTDNIKSAPKIDATICKINWDIDVVNIHNLIRGLSPVPCAFTFIHGKKIKIYQATYVLENHTVQRGTILCNGKNELKIAAANGWLIVKILQMEGKKKMGIVDFLNGYKVENYTQTD